MTVELQQTRELASRVVAEVSRVIVGQESLLQQVMVALLVRGHALVEGVPGTAKTLLVKAVAHCLGCDFRRVQMTADLMPSDITGNSVFDLASSSFHLRHGPIFTDILLADEINRAPAKTQSALLEGMQERQVTLDGVSHPLPPVFTVFATQNPIEFEGTYPLPEAQLDRFLMKMVVDYPSEVEELEILRRRQQGFRDDDLRAAGLTPVVATAELQQARQTLSQVAISDEVLRYIAALIRFTRHSPHLVSGCSPRAGTQLLEASRALAALRGRAFLTPDEVKEMALPVLRHRLILRPEADIEGLSADDVLTTVLSAVPVPR